MKKEHSQIQYIKEREKCKIKSNSKETKKNHTKSRINMINIDTECSRLLPINHSENKKINWKELNLEYKTICKNSLAVILSNLLSFSIPLIGVFSMGRLVNIY